MSRRRRVSINLHVRLELGTLIFILLLIMSGGALVQDYILVCPRCSLVKFLKDTNQLSKYLLILQENQSDLSKGINVLNGDKS